MQWIDAHEKEIISDYKHLHQHPELAFQEVETSAFLIAGLKKAGFTIATRPEGTGFVATLDSGKPGPVFGMRADMDALPMDETSGVAWTSTVPGVAHTCGHDANSVMVMWAGKYLAAKGLQRGTLKLVFQPAEEVMAGARAMIRDGMVEGIDELVTIHLKGVNELQNNEACAGVKHSACAHVRVHIEGSAAHGAHPHLGINAAEAAALVIHAVQGVHCTPVVPHSVKATRIIAGTSASNIIPKHAEVSFDLRSQTNDVMSMLLERTTIAIENACRCCGAECNVEVVFSGPAAMENADLLQDTAASIAAVMGECKPALNAAGSEDFHCYSVEAGIKTAIIGLGADLKPCGHASDMTFDLSALAKGAKILVHLGTSKLC